MAVGPTDELDMALVKKYGNLRMDNPIVGNSMVDPDRIFEAMNDYGNMQRILLNMKQNLNNVCKDAVTMNIQYYKSHQPKTVEVV